LVGEDAGGGGKGEGEGEGEGGCMIVKTNKLSRVERKIVGW
jgi:hypothetical protein